MNMYVQIPNLNLEGTVCNHFLFFLIPRSCLEMKCPTEVLFSALVRETSNQKNENKPKMTRLGSKIQKPKNYVALLITI